MPRASLYNDTRFPGGVSPLVILFMGYRMVGRTGWTVSYGGDCQYLLEAAHG